jgi:hypothetical protein
MTSTGFRFCFRLRNLATGLFLALLIPLTAAAQGTGTISGFVTDPSGSAVPDTKVTATQVEEQIERTVMTNAEGFYTFNAMPPGDYTMVAEKTGFERLLRTGAVLTLNQNLRVDLRLELGQVTQEVTVAGQAPVVDTRSGALSSLVGTQQVESLPLNGRDVVGLSAILPGVNSVFAPQQMSDTRSGPTMDVNGSEFTQNMFTLNGGYFMNPSRSTGMIYPPPDAVQELSIQALDFSPEYGRNAGAQVNVVTKSGTNQFHGDAFEFLRNTDLNARNFFSPTQTPYRMNQFGATAGGPIRRDKLFFFGAYQGTINHSASLSAVADVPSQAEREGNFTGFTSTLTDPTNPITGLPMTNPSGAPCILNNIVDSKCFSQNANYLLPLIPQSSTGQVVTIGAEPWDDTQVLGRMDWNQSTKHTFSGDFYVDHDYQNYENLEGGSISNYVTGFTSSQTTMITLNDTYSFSPNLLNQFTASFIRTMTDIGVSKTIEPSAMGIDSPLYAEGGAVSENVGSLFSFFGSYGPVYFRSHNWQFHDVVTWTKGRHNVKFGGEWLSLSFDQIFLGPPTATFSGTESGSEVADFLLGSYYSWGDGFGVTTNDDYQKAPSLFIQDEFKMFPRFTLTYGLRWEPLLPWYDKYNRLSSLADISTDPTAQSTLFPSAPPGILFAGDPGVPRGLSPRRWKYFGPRVGFAWDVFGNGRTSVRGAYGVFFDSIDADSVSQQTGPWTGVQNLYNGLISEPYTSVNAPTPPVFPTSFGCVKTSAFPGVNCPLYPLPLSGLYDSSNLLTPYIQQWNLTLQHQLAHTFMVQAGYVGKEGMHLNGWGSINPAVYETDPITGAPSSEANASDRVPYLPGILAPSVLEHSNPYRSWYHALQAQVIKRTSHGVSFTTAYTFSKSVDNSSNIIWDYAYDDPFNLRYQKGRSSFDRRNVFTGSVIWSPRWTSTNRLQNTALGGWTFSAMPVFESGTPETIYAGIDVALDGTGGRQHAQFVPGASLKGHWSNTGQMVNEYFNTAAFVPPTQEVAGTYGNSGRNILTLPGLSVVNFAVTKDFKVAEPLHAQFRAEFFNLFNRANFGCGGGDFSPLIQGNWNDSDGCGDPVNTATAGNFGQLTTAGDGRVIQFALKLFW